MHEPTIPPPSPGASLRDSLRWSSIRALWSEHPGFFYYAGHLLTIWGIALSNLFLGLLLLDSGRRRRELTWRSEQGALLRPLGLYVTFLVVAVIFSVDPAESAGGLREILSLATLPLGLAVLRGERDVRRIFDALLVMITVLAVIGLGQFYFTSLGSLHSRITGGFSHYQTYAGVLLVGDFLLLARIVRDGWTSSRWVSLLLINWTLILTLTRGPWVALVLTMGGYLLLRARKRYLALAVAVGALIAFPVLHFVPEVRARAVSIVDVQDPSNYDRLCMLEAGLYMISERPLFGIGPDMVKERYPIYRHPTAPRLTVPHLHNAWLEIAAERGILSLLAYLWLIGAGLWAAWRFGNADGGREGPRADLYLGVILAVIGFNIAGFFEDNWRDTEVQRLILFLLAAPFVLRAASTAPSGEPTDEDAAA